MMLTRWVGRLIAANVVMFVLTQIRPEITQELMWVPARLFERPWTPITYLFLHDGVMHLLFNMLGLLFFGPRLEEELGERHFLLLYFFSGIAGALLSIVTPFTAIVGASGAVYGIFFGFARYWPHERIFIWGIIPVEARTLVIIMTALSLFGGFSEGGNIAHFAHLGGFVGGWLFLIYRDRYVRTMLPQTVVTATAPSAADIRRWKGIDPTRLHEVNRTELERILGKLNVSGAQGLTETERLFLDRFSEL